MRPPLMPRAFYCGGCNTKTLDRTGDGWLVLSQGDATRPKGVRWLGHFCSPACLLAWLDARRQKDAIAEAAIPEPVPATAPTVENHNTETLVPKPGPHLFRAKARR